MARYSKTKPRKSLKTLQDKEFARHTARRAKETGSEGGAAQDKMRKRHWKMWKKRHDAEVDRKWDIKKAKERRIKSTKEPMPVKAIEGRKAKRPDEKMPESKKRSKAARLYGDWLKD